MYYIRVVQPLKAYPFETQDIPPRAVVLGVFAASGEERPLDTGLVLCLCKPAYTEFITRVKDLRLVSLPVHWRGTAEEEVLRMYPRVEVRVIADSPDRLVPKQGRLLDGQEGSQTDRCVQGNVFDVLSCTNPSRSALATWLLHSSVGRECWVAPCHVWTRHALETRKQERKLIKHTHTPKTLLHSNMRPPP